MQSHPSATSNLKMPLVGRSAGREEAKYLAAAQEPLASIASVLADKGMRPEECYRLCWEAIT